MTDKENNLGGVKNRLISSAHVDSYNFSYNKKASIISGDIQLAAVMLIGMIGCLMLFVGFSSLLSGLATLNILQTVIGGILISYSKGLIDNLYEQL